MLCAAAISDILIANAPPDIKSCAFNSFHNAFEDAVEVAKYPLKLPDSKLNIDMSTFYEKTSPDLSFPPKRGPKISEPGYRRSEAGFCQNRSI